MKVIFLDNDGVICLSNNWGSRFKKESKFKKTNVIESRKELPVNCRFDNFDKKAIRVLNEIIEKTNTEIVVSSDWRYHATLEEIGDYYLSQGILKKPIGVTKKFSHCTVRVENFELLRGISLEQERAIEIREYLFDNPNITHWVAVDDLNMGKKMFESSFFSDLDSSWALDNFVHVPNSYEGIKQSGIKEKIFKFLD